MARTHGQLAKETTFAHFINTKIQHLERAYKIFEQACENLNFVKFAGPVGDKTIELKMFEEYVNEFYNTKNTDLEFTQIVPRDLYANLMYGIVSLGIAVEKIALEIRLMSQSGIEEVSERFYVNQVGSSAMPHKRNPITCENIMGLTRLLKSYLAPSVENINLWGYRDMTHSSVERVIIPDSFHLLCTILNKMTDVVDNLNVNEENIIDNITDVNMSTVILFKLTEILGRTAAYEETQNIMFEAIKENKQPEQLLYERFQIKIES
jgi:adenylosuccinate lyase